MPSIPFPATSKHHPPTPSSNITGVTSSTIPSACSTSSSMASSIGPTGARPGWHSVSRTASCRPISSMPTILKISSPSPPHPDYDILDIHFGEMEAPDEWTEYELGSLIPIRDELMEGDLRALYIVWLTAQIMIEGYDEEEYEDEEEEEDWEITVPPVPPGFGTLTAAQYALAELLQVPQELLLAAAHHSKAAAPSPGDDFAAWVKLLPPDRQNDYLVRLAHNEPGLSRQLVRELRELGQDKTRAAPSTGEEVTYATLLTESREIRARQEREKREQAQAARLRHLQEVHDHQDTYWHQVEQAVMRGTGTGYDEALRSLVELRDAADHFNETQKFQDHFRAWVRPHLRRPAFVKRLQAHSFTLPEA